MRPEKFSNYKYKADPNISADEIKAKVAESKKRRIQEKTLKEEEERLKY